MNKRLISIFLVIALLISCVPTFDLAYAEVEYMEHVQITDKVSLVEKKEIKVGEKIDLYAQIINNQGDKVTDYSKKDTKYSWTSQNDAKATVTVTDNVYGIGTIEGIEAGTLKITVESIDCENCEPKEIEITVIEDQPKEVIESKDYTDMIDTSLEKVKNYYSSQGELEYLPAMAYYHSSNDLNIDKVKKYKDDYATNCCKGIISAIISKKDPRKFKCNGTTLDYVNALIEIQKKGEGKFHRSFDWHAYCMLALDMAGADYDKEKALEEIKKNFETNGDKAYVLKYNRENIEYTAIGLMALSNHKDIDWVKEYITKGVKYIKSKQNEYGGFGAYGTPPTERPKLIGNIIQGLIAVGEDPLSSEYIKNGKSMLDILISCQNEETYYTDNNGAFNSSSNSNRIDKTGTEIAFAALADLKQGKSMYHEIKIDEDETPGGDESTPSDIVINLSQNEVIEGETLNIEYKVVDDKNKEVKGPYVIWTSSDESIASVKDGVITGKKAGDIIITVKVENTSVTKIINIEVVKRKAANIRIYLNEKEVKEELNIKGIDKTLTFTAKISDQKDKLMPSQEVIWSSDNENIAVIDIDGKVTIKSVGKVKIVGKVKDMESITNTVVLNIVPIVPTRLEVSLDQKNIVIGSKLKINVLAYDQDNEVLKNPNIIWEVEPKDMATIDDKYILSVLKQGSMRIKAKIAKTDKDFVESNILSLKAVKSKTREEKIDEAIDNLILRYKNPTFYGPDGLSSKYTDKLALALRSSGMNIEDINKTKNIFRTSAGAYGLLNTSKNIITLIAVNEDPKEQVEKILDNSFVFYKDIKEEDVDGLVYAIIALDMADVDYNKKEAVKALISMMKKDSDGKIYIESYEKINANLTAKAMIALSKHKDIVNVTDTINGIKKCLKSLQCESGLIKDLYDSGDEGSCRVTSEVIQAIIALGENPLDEYWMIEDMHKNNLVDAMLACRDGQRFRRSLNGSVANPQTDAAMAALADLKIGKSMYHELKYVKVGAPSKIEITNEDPIEVVESYTVQIKATVYDKDNNVVRNESIQWESSDPKKATVENGEVKALEDGIVTIKVSIANQPEIMKEITVKIKSGVSDDVLKEKLKKEINFLKAHHEAYRQYEFLAAPAAIISGIDKKEVQDKLYKYRKYTSTYQYAKLIISALGAGLNPRSIKIEGSVTNTVDILRAAQVKDGKNKGQFIINSYSDIDSIEGLGYAIIALDMADADYDEEAAINALINLLKDLDIKTKLGKDEVKIKAVALTAFANHKSIEGVNEQIETIIKLIKDELEDEKNEEGEFGSKQGGNSVIATARVIQALIANDINPLYSKEWRKGKNTVLSNLLKKKYEHPTDISKSGFSAFEGGSREYHSTYYAFAAFTDMYTNESMFKRLAIQYDGSTSVGEIAKLDILHPEKNKMLMGQTLKLQVSAFDNKNSIVENPAVLWKSSDDTIASVKDGLVQGIKPGKVKIIAYVKDKDIESEIDIWVEDLDVKNIEIQCKKNRVRVDDDIPLDVKAFNKIDGEIEGKKFLWTIDNENISKLYEKEGKMYLKANAKGKVVVKAVLEDDPNMMDEFIIHIFDEKSVKVKIRVEGLDETIIPLTEIEVENLDLGKYSDGSSILEENPTAMNALIQVLEENHIDCMDKKQFDARKDLSNIDNINGIKESEDRPNGGWMYFIDDQYIGQGMKNKEIQEGNMISVVYLKDYTKQSYAYFYRSEKKIKPNTSFTINLKANVSKTKAMDEYEKIDIENAQIFVNGKPYVVEGKNVVTDQDGNAVLKFEKEGEYHITATRIKDGIVNITKPYCKVIATNELEQFEIKLNNEKYPKGEEARLTMTIKNSDEEPSNMLCKIQLCDESNKVLKSSSVEKVLEGNGETTLAPGFSIPDEGHYKIKIFLSDGKEENIFESTKTIETN
ncbi:Ig-like domain-containing protein [Crassaminicella profunda]|uniref:Ig-like domain-containing protein n=1 Tax=Crassaminicella profunda TaxID=1286698 RepID=UPI001CA72C13|nr:Ig-like domain-containing protein [Crassaminicella profunda]QZY55696.1 Ig-like domain-containing protein [Crassaminicella profunda]